MITLNLAERDGKGNATGRRLEHNFETGLNAAIWFDKQRGHSIERDLQAVEHDIPPIQWVKNNA